MLVRSSGSEAVVEVYSGETTLPLNYPLPPFLLILLLLLLLNLKDNSPSKLSITSISIDVVVVVVVVKFERQPSL